MAGGAIKWEVEQDVHGVKSVYAANKPLWVYVIEGDYALWVDTGIDRTPAEVVIPYLVSRALRAWSRTQVAVITHADVDHFGGIKGLQAHRTDTLVLAHGADKAWIESPEAVLRERYEMHAADGLALTEERRAILNERGGGGGKVDVTLVGGEQFDLGRGGVWRVLHTPGHSAGHLALWCAERRCAIVGDAVLDWGVPDDTGKLIAPPPYYEVDAYLETVAAIEALDADRLFTSHYGLLDRAAARQLLANSREAVRRLDEALATVLRASKEGLGLAELCLRTGELAGYWEPPLWPGLADPISAHLRRWLRKGLVERIAKGARAIYRWQPRLSS